ncbi:hypothetical protein LF1_10250 [Rubripirellula obstinata]|uniref:GTP-binding protein n=1 Tax=Rubripirellula obstinata TaxID=406547 RepID=A0A5B1CF42_9BACT|nr:DUF4416 family protein [Rubripirellula obstinata]KAA1258505.1 hypothetical protein LF1_10250 [Rubripirellula obstinata]
MAKIRLIEPVIRLCAIITKFDAARDWAISQIETHWGPVALVSPAVPFQAGGFYDDEMGTDLTKVIVAVETFADPAGLSDWKLQTNAWELEYANQVDPTITRQGITRPVNLDAGYLSQAKLVLATIKDRDHRIYLRDGIFAEVTLNYVGKRWIHHRWSYPSYRTDEVAGFAMQCRSRLREYLISTGQIRKVDSQS